MPHNKHIEEIIKELETSKWPWYEVLPSKSKMMLRGFLRGVLESYGNKMKEEGRGEERKNNRENRLTAREIIKLEAANNT